jgi:hypothetical protein
MADIRTGSDTTVIAVPAPLSTTGGGTEATSLRVTVATDSTGVLSVDDNGGTLSVDDGGGVLTVDGTVTANAGTNLNTSALALEAGGNLATAVASLSVIDDWDESDRAKVNPIAGQVGVQGASGTVTALTQRVVLATDVALPAGTNAIGKLSANSGVDIGDVDVTSLPALPAGSNNIGDVDVLTIAAGTNAIGNVGLVPRTTGGLTPFHLVSAATTNATNVKASAGQLFGWFITNSNASMRKVTFHNTAGTPTAGASVFFTLNIPGSGAANIMNGMGIAFGTGIAITTTTDLTDAGTTAVGVGDLTINLFYT